MTDLQIDALLKEKYFDELNILRTLFLLYFGEDFFINQQKANTVDEEVSRCFIITLPKLPNSDKAYAYSLLKKCFAFF
jgi:hypothetical protein